MADPRGYFVSKKLAIILGCVFVASLVVVGIAVGVSKSNGATGEPEPSAAPSEAPTIAPTVAPTDPPSDCPWCELRIPRDAYLPKKYDLTLEPDLEPLEGNRFTGEVHATVEVLKPTSVFMIHIKDLNVTSTELSEPHEVAESFHYVENQFWVIKTKAEVPKGDLVLKLKFDGSLVNGIVGFYKSTYKDSSGKVHNLATSKFEPSDARKAFPCFDEPNLKANFTVSLIYKESYGGNGGYYALSNMPKDGDAIDLGNGKRKQKFQESVKMSTYLACFIVCDFEHETKKTKSGKDFSVYSPKGTLSQALYALGIGVKIIDYYEEFFMIDYPLPKQDMIAIPDFPSGAMEHWGLITYRMTSMLYDSSMASLSEKQRVTTVVAHELAHMWFGNLVTMDWWDDLWLNEGFASFVEYLGTDKAEPEFEVLDQFLSLDMKGVMELDSTKASHPIITKVDSPNQITELFDTITYSKGCSVIRMLESYLGEKDFRNGVKRYLTKHSWANAKNADLWAALTEDSTANVDVASLMSSWTKKSHYPLVTVDSVTATSGSSQISLKQNPFLLNEAAKVPDTVWEIPLMTVGSDGSKKVNDTQLFKSTTGSITIPVDVSGGWFKLNTGQYGFFRVLYDEASWTKLTSVLKNSPDALAAVDRAGLLDDAFNLARAGKMSYDKALTVLAYLDKETEYIPWNIVSSALNYITDNYEGPQAGKWRKFVAEKAAKVLEDIGFEVRADDKFPTKRLRPTLISLACRHGDSKCLENTKAKFDAWLADPSDVANAVDVNVRAQIYRYGMIDAGDDKWTKVHEIYKKTTIPQEKKKLRYAMAMPRTPWILNRFIDYAKNENEGFKSQDYFGIMELISDNDVGLPIVWDYIKSHWVDIVARFTINDRYLGRMIKRIISHFNTDFQLKDVEAFFAAYPEAGAGARARQQGLTNIRDNIAWRARFEDELTKWLEKLP